MRAIRVTAPDATIEELDRLAAMFRTNRGEVIRRLLVARAVAMKSDRAWADEVRLHLTHCCIGSIKNSYADPETGE